MEFLDGLFSVCTEDAVLVDAQRPLKRGIIQPLRITAGRLFQISGAEDFSRPVRRIRCRTGHVGDLPDIRVHDLRHSHVSLCIELGYSIVLVARRIGDTVPVVMRTYAHLYPNKQQELVSKLEAIGSPTSNNDDSDLMSLG